MDDEDYEENSAPEVGYRRPPQAHQFKKGRSGNPKGRPRKRKAPAVPAGMSVPAAQVILAEAGRLVQVREGEGVHEVTTLQALTRALNVGGLKGNRRAQVDAIRLARQAEEVAERDWAETLTSVFDYKRVTSEVLAEAEARKRPAPDIIPHPDDLVVDFANRRVLYNGPSDEAEKARWDYLKSARDDAQWMLDNFYTPGPDGKPRPSDARMKAIDRAIIQFHDGVFPDEKTRRAPGFNIHDWRRQNGVLARAKQGGMKAFIPEDLRVPPRPVENHILPDDL